MNTAAQANAGSGPPSGGEVTRIIAPRTHDLGGLSVRRCLPVAGCKAVGPWVFFDHFGPVTLAPGPGPNLRPHPHVNLATVTYLFAGALLHRDSLGSAQAIRPGDINLMVAGRGIVHSERESPEATRSARPLHGLQLWLALPQADEEIEPSFHHYPASTIPALTVQGVAVRVMMGAAFGVPSPVRTFASTLYAEAGLQPGQRLLLPEAVQRAVYVAQGRVRIGDKAIPAHAMAVLGDVGAPVTLHASDDSRVAIIGGENLGRRFIDWNFVSSRKERIARARDDWANGRFPKVPGDEVEFIPLPA